jgi:hypothetical protein
MVESKEFTFYFVDITHEPLHLDKLSFVQWTIVDMPTGFMWITTFLDGAFEYGDGSKFWGYVWSNAEPLYVGFCIFA